MIFYRDIDFEHECWCYNIPNTFSNDNLQKIDEYVSKQELSDATVIKTDSGVVDDEHVPSDFRSTKMCWMCDDFEEIRSVYDEASSIVRQVNDNIWKYSIEGFEAIQYGEYRSEENGHYNWHMDTPARCNGGDIRKITFVIGLTDEYEGGLFETKTVETKSIKIKRGDIVVLPSFILHRVTPVTQGVRKTIVGWAKGPNFT